MTAPGRACRALTLAGTLLTLLPFWGVANGQESRPQSPPPKAGTPASKPAQPTASPPPTRKSDPEAIAVIDRYMEAMGGKAAMKAIQSRESHFVNKKFSPTGITEMKMIRFLKRPAKIREEWELPGLGLQKEPLHFIQVYDGQKGWVKTMGFVSPLNGRTLTVFVWDKPIDDFFMAWKDDGYTIQKLPDEAIDGVPVSVVETTSFAGRQKVRYSFSKENSLLQRKVWNEPGARGQVRKEVLYGEYTRIRFRDDPNRWVMFPVNQKIFEDGELSLEKEYEKIVINGKVRDEIFGRPDGPNFEDRPKDKRPAPAPTSQPASQPGGGTKPPKAPTSKPKGG